MLKKFNQHKPLLFAFIFVFIGWLIVFILKRWDQFTQVYYPDFYAWFYPKYTTVFGKVPFSIGDIIYIVLGLILVITSFFAIRCLLFGQQWRGKRIIARLIKFGAMMYVLFHLVWGFNYYKPNLSESLQGENYTLEELKYIATDTFEKSKMLREGLPEDQKGILKYDRKSFYQHLPQNLHLDDLSLKYAKVPQKNLKKFSMFSWFMRYFGVGGYYNPFTAETQITRCSPGTSVPFSMAHEQAHQMGYATEYEANFMGYLTCIQSENKAMAYSANFKALKYVLNEIYPQDTAFVRTTLRNFSPAMQRDYQAEQDFYDKYSGSADQLFSAMNNAYLKANNQQEGIASYNRFVELLVGAYRKYEFPQKVKTLE